MNVRMMGVVLTSIALVFLFAGCLPGGGHSTQDDPAGFFMGIWHGWIAPISLIWGLFDAPIRVYETANTGWWYDFGFYIAIIGGFGGISLVRKRSGDKE